MKNYNLGFISNENIAEHVRNTVMQYSRSIDLKAFKKNNIDAIKLTFDAKIYGKSFEEIIDSECVRQMDKTNTNKIGYFHQNLFRYAGNGWEVPKEGFDIVNHEKHIFVEMKNKHNTMNSASAKNTYIKMQNQILIDDQATCMLVEAIALQSQNKKWNIRIDEKQYSNERIRRISMDKFYEIVFGDKFAFAKLCKALPSILDDVIKEESSCSLKNSVLDELSDISKDTLKNLYLLSFKTYDGFDKF